MERRVVLDSALVISFAESIRLHALSPYKCSCEQALDVRALPRPARLDHCSLGDTLLRRRTRRYFEDRPLSAQQTADLLFYTAGPLFEEEHPVWGTVVKKCSPSPGARHPTELYCAIRGGGEAPGGLHHYCTRHHALALLAPEPPFDVTAFLSDVMAGQEWFTDAPLTCFMTCVRDRLAFKYGSARAYRVAHLDAGHCCQTFVLTATGLGLGASETAAFSDTAIERALGIDGVGEFVMYAAGAGHPRPHVTNQRTRLRLSEHPPAGASVGLPDT